MITLGALSKSIGGVVERREIQMRGNVQPRWGYGRMARIVCGGVESIVEVLVAFDGFVPRSISKFFKLLQVEMDSVGEVRKFKWQQIGVS